MARDTAQPRVHLGQSGSGSIAPAIFALVERGTILRPQHARELRARVLLRFREDYPDVEIDLHGDQILVADVEHERANDLVIEGSFQDLLVLMSAPLMRGLPRPTSATGRAALGRLANGRIELHGPIGLARGLLKLISTLPDKHTPRPSQDLIVVERSAAA